MSRTRNVGQAGLTSIDFNQVCLKLGVATPYCEGKWTELDEDDLRVLYALLTKDVLGSGSAAASSQTLNLLAAFCAAGIQWFGRQKDIVINDKTGT